MSLNLDFSFYYILFCLIIALFFSYFLYRNEKKIFSEKLVLFLSFLRFLSVFLICLLLFNPILNIVSKSFEKPIVIVAQDVSKSISEDVFDDLKVLENFDKDFDVRFISFSDKVDLGLSRERNGLKTSFSSLFSEIENRYSNKNLSSIVLASDGIYNSGSNPLYFKNLNVPIYSIALGDTTVKKDIGILDVDFNKIVFLGNKFSIDVSIFGTKTNQKTTSFSIYNNGVKVISELINISNSNYTKNRYNLEAKKVGLQEYTIVLDGLRDEENLNNNVFKFFVDVIDTRNKILILNSFVHPDLATYKNIIESNKNYEIDSYKTTDFNGDINDYQLIVLFGLDLSANTLNLLYNSSVPLIVFETNDFDFRDQNNQIISFISEDILEVVGVAKNKTFNKFKFSDKFLQFIKSAPPLLTNYGKFSFFDNIEFIIEQKVNGILSNKPIISLYEGNNRRIAFVNAQGFWKWKLYDFSINDNHNNINELFLKLTQYQVLEKDKSRFRINYKTKFLEDENISFEANLFNESYELVVDKEIDMYISDNNENEYRYQFLNDGKNYYLDIGKMSVGKYSYSAKVKSSDLQKRGSFHVVPIQLEENSLVANHKLLREMSKRSNGNIYFIHQLDDLMKKVFNKRNNIKVIYLTEKMQGIINIPWILLILLSVIFIEWFVRRYNGLV